MVDCNATMTVRHWMSCTRCKCTTGSSTRLSCCCTWHTQDNVQYISEVPESVSTHPCHHLHFACTTALMVSRSSTKLAKEPSSISNYCHQHWHII